uniref:Uncharacterized protein n=1 Tax=Cacopsylla melanoneura TaxID=428564 RepID=A0A8D8YG96_9HEMI
MELYVVLLIIPMFSLCTAVVYDEIAWGDVDPYTEINFHLQNLNGKNLCDPDRNLCERDAKDAIKKFFDGKEVRANCEDCPEHKNICWRKVQRKRKKKMKKRRRKKPKKRKRKLKTEMMQ